MPRACQIFKFLKSCSGNKPPRLLYYCMKILECAISDVGTTLTIAIKVLACAIFSHCWCLCSNHLTMFYVKHSNKNI